MPNHYHLLIQTPEGNISRAMRHINGVYTQRFNRRLLAGLSRCAWKVLSLYLTEATPLEDAKAGAVIAVQSFRKNWARLIQKIYQVDPLLCPKCHGAMKVIGFIEDDAVIEKILRHLGLWETRGHDPPKSGDQLPATHERELTYDGTYSQLPPSDSWTR